ncbi:ABC transporter permease subunit [Escherichia coli]
MGVSTIKIIWHVMVKEARPSLVLGLTIATIGLIGATAMAGLVGAGGRGDRWQIVICATFLLRGCQTHLREHCER